MADVLHLVRITIEAASPISSASGETWLYDMELVRDANGLPEIAGPSLQGVFNHLYESVHGRNKTWRRKFGYGERDFEARELESGENPEGATAGLFFSFAKIHGSNDKAMYGLDTEAPNFSDELLLQLAADAPVARDHVALDERHVAAGRAKFERVAVPKGTRFSFEIAMWGRPDATEDDEKKALIKLVGLMKHPAFRIGGAARRGYGKIKLLRAKHIALKLSDPAAIRDKRDKACSETDGFDCIINELNAPNSGAVTIAVDLHPVGLWRVGSTGLALRTAHYELRSSPNDEGRGGPDGRAKDVDLVPIREPWIDWSGNAGKLREPQRSADEGAQTVTFVVPGSAIKGPLAHRTLFHWNRLASAGERMIDPAEWERQPTAEARKSKIEEIKDQSGLWAKRTRELETLLGTEKKRVGSEQRSRRAGDGGRAARLIVDDAEVSVDPTNAVGALDHNSIDRFTGGVRNRMLYSEEAVLGGVIKVAIIILPALDDEGRTIAAGFPADLRKSFCHALSDLVQRRLALGAKSLGFCTGDKPVFGGDETQSSLWKESWETVTSSGASREREGRAA